MAEQGSGPGIDRRVVGRYRVLEEAARGGSGAVFRALGPDGRAVALKVLLSGGRSTPTQRERFAREVQALLRLRHPGVVALLDAGEHQGVPYLVQEWVAGETLAHRVERGGRLDPRSAAETVRRLALALQHCHERGVLHRDLKPGNVLIRSAGAPAQGPELGGEPLLTDFGLAREIEQSHTQLTRSGVAMGTPGYWPPEQVQLDPARIGPWSDVYGLGGLLHFCLTGQRPHDGQTLSELLVALARPPVAPGRRVPGIPPALDEVCLRCLALAPEERYPSAAAVAEALESWSSGRRASSARLGPLPAAVPASPGSLGAGPGSLVAGGPRDRRSGALPLALGLLAAGLVGACGVLLLAEPGQRAPAAPGQEAPPAEPGPGAVDESSQSPPPSSAGSATPAAASAAQDPWAGTPPEVRALCQEAWERSRAGDLPGALLAYDRALELDPQRVLVLYNRGVVRQSAGDVRGALRDFDLAATLDPGHVPSLLNRGLCRQGLGLTDQALADFERVLALDPGVAQAWNNRAMVRHLRGDLAGALADYTRGLELDPRDPRHWANRGSCRAGLGDLTGCLQDYDQALTLLPDDPGLLTNRALMRKRAGDYAGAFEDFERAIARDPAFGQAWYNRGSVREELGDLSGAAADYEQAMALRFPAAFTARGALRQQAQDYLGALEDYRVALELDPRDAVALYNRGLCRIGLGQEVEAVPDLEAAARLAPGAAWAGGALAEAARLRSKLGQ